MNLITIYLRPDGRLRAGWRFAIYLIAYYLVRALLGWMVVPALVRGSLALVVALRLVGSLLVSWLMLRFLEGRRLSHIGLGLDPGWGVALGLGSAVGVLAIGSMTGVFLLVGGLHFVPAALPPPESATALLRFTPVLLLAAFSEEVMFRGYPFQLLVEGTGRYLAVGGTSLLFGLMHLGNPAADALSTTNTVLAGILFCVAYLQAESLWYAIGMHFSWNWTMAAIGYQVSGLDMPSLGWVAVVPPDLVWLHGGNYGPEGGVVCVVMLTAMIAGLCFAPRRMGCRRIGRTQPDNAPEPSAAVASGTTSIFS